jgi:hypothetical protein
MKRLSAIIVIAGLSLSSNPSAALAAVNPGAACKKLGEISASPDRKYICIKSGKKLIWGKRLQDAQSPKMAPTDSIAIRVDSLLSTRTGASGVFLKEVNGLVISDFQSGYVFEPASSIKALVALYIFDLVKSGKIKLSDKFPAITSANPHGCPSPKTKGTESLESAIEKMMQVSDNDRTNALILHLGAAKINSFAKRVGLKNTRLAITSSFPGFNFMGCVIPANVSNNPVTVSGNTSTLQDLTKIWELASSLPSPIREQFMKLTAGREMYEATGSDFTGIWQSLSQIVKEESPTNLEVSSIDRFINEMGSNSKGGSAAVCFKTANCTTVRWWVSMVSLTTIPVCLSDKSVGKRGYVWGYFNSGADSNSVDMNESNGATAGFSKVGAEPIREQIREALRGWAACES